MTNDGATLANGCGVPRASAARPSARSAGAPPAGAPGVAQARGGGRDIAKGTGRSASPGDSRRPGAGRRRPSRPGRRPGWHRPPRRRRAPRPAAPPATGRRSAARVRSPDDPLLHVGFGTGREADHAEDLVAAADVGDEVVVGPGVAGHRHAREEIRGDAALPAGYQAGFRIQAQVGGQRADHVAGQVDHVRALARRFQVRVQRRSGIRALRARNML